MEWSFSNDRAIYVQIVELMILAIVSGEISPGDKLLSVRDYAESAGVNPNTMQKALSELEATGLVYSSRTSGRFVTDDKERIKAQKHIIAQEKTKEFLDKMQAMGFSVEEVSEIIQNTKGELK